MLIFLWIDIICDEKDEELMKIYENIYGKINFDLETSKIEFPNRSKSEDDFINKMTNNIITDYLIDKINLDNSKNIKLKEGENSDNDESNIENYYINIETDEKKTISVKNKFLKFEDNSCRFDSLYSYLYMK